MNFNKSVRISLATLCITVLLAPSLANAQDKEKKRLQAAGTVLDDFGKMKESIPSSLLKVTEGIIIVPKLINAGFVVGGKRGRGIAMVKREDGSWSNPVFVTITGGSVGLQVGIQSVELVLVFKHSSSLTGIKKSSFTLGGDLSIAAGPVGRNSTANTDYKLDAEVYSYSRSKGLFAGISLNGASLEFDTAADTNFYGKGMGPAEIFASQGDPDDAVTKIKTSLSSLK
ncbi:lipid-binding SYLF domain-containing protein [Pedobacter jeongneungensis]|uniref:lipid-binding SYLF domain-containing protein n=1 Tax=Pedobacter jeongneungensis TaxID=947309 RepID=UPI0004689DEF|nr:lipid-binding SYLF domain-containing protein [Pedobacter jeongneungensis]